MADEILKEIAAQLRQPHGEHANETGERMNKGNYQMNLFAIETLNPKPDDEILEIGMGNGFFVKDILGTNPSVKYTGCDFSAEMVLAATQLNEPFVKTGQAAFQLTSANSLPFGAESFSKVFTVNTVYFWDNPTLILNEIKRVLKPDGLLLVAFRPKSLMELYPFTQYGFTLYTIEELGALLSAHGFRIISALEDREPDFEFNGQTLASGSAVIVAGETD